MKAIVVAAGQGFEVDGMNKVLITDPFSGKTILENLIEIFGPKNMTIVVGYRAINIMHRYPNLNYVYNPDWKISNNSYSLGLALNEDPCFVLSSDLIFDKKIVEEMICGADNLVLTERRSSRILTALSCSVENGKITDIYPGAIKSVDDPEAIGIYKVANKRVLKVWKQNCLQHGNLFLGQNLPLNLDVDILSFDKMSHRFFEINTPFDFLKVLDDKNNRGL
jgi:choline kinase